MTWVRSRKPDLPFKLLRLTPGKGGPHTRAPPRTVQGELLPLKHLCPSGIWKNHSSCLFLSRFVYFATVLYNKIDHWR